METLKKLRRLAEPGDWCFSFDLQDGYHAVGIDPDFQKYMQFDLQGQLFQFSALPFGWSDAPRIFVKFMKVMVEALRSPGAAEDRRELLKLKDGRVATPRYEVRRRAGGVHQELRRRGARVLPYMDDFLIIAKTKEEAFVQRERVQRVLARLGLTRNEKKGQWEPGQLIEHLGLEVDLRDGLFRVTAARVAKIHAQAKVIICTASRDRSLAYDWRGEINWVNPPWALLDEEGPLCPEQTRRFAAAGDVEVGRDHVPHPPEAVSNSSYVVPVGTKLRIYWELDDAWYPGAVALFDEDGFANIVYDDGDKEVVDLANERYEIIGDVEPPVNVKNIFELGTSEHTDLAVQMQQAALQPTTKGNYDPKADQQVLTNEVLTERTYLPAQHVWAAQQAATTMKPTTLDELRLLRACVYTVFAYVTFGRPDTGPSGPSLGEVDFFENSDRKCAR
ncbi:hypothetical protein CYMTET_39998 [Cymbomonas tetramitiformis]|uniref:Reverse transcriptase domain-containing protein n=1 Tax=Cymbomonas tetramitiformis TaxID=36881 RepID=A0AAE0F520_9CHLO|nr:hypothetical protein CYMTET_39998 [Cymbomonas tetramitiformis]